MRSLFMGFCLLFASFAWANGRYPAAGQFVQSPSNPQHFLAQTTYGFLQSLDGGSSWHWICEGSIGYDGQEDPFVGITQADITIAATTQGLSVSSDNGCGWAKVKAPEFVGRLPAIDLVIDPNNAARVVVLITAEDQKHNQLLESLDNGATWKLLGKPLPDNVQGLTLELAPSQPGRIYVSAWANPDLNAHALLHTDDNGETWKQLPFAPTLTENGVQVPADQTEVAGTYIGAVDPTQPDTVWLRMRRSFHPDQLWRTQDAGQTWQQIFVAKTGRMPGFALSPDGKQVVVGTPQPVPGIWRAQTADLKFQQQNTISGNCLKWLKTGLYVCADDDIDGFTLGISQDAGTTIQPIHRRKELQQLACGELTRTQVVCARLWPTVAYQLGVGEDDTPVTPPPKSGCMAQRSVADLAAGSLLAGLLAVLLVRRQRRMGENC